VESSDRLRRHLLIGFAAALVLYALFFSLDQHIRQRKGPWEVTFGTNKTGTPFIEVTQPTLQIHTAILFAGEHATNTGTVRFDQPEKPIPFGATKFEDLTYLPGSVVFGIFGHEVELLPRILYLNKKEHPWRRDEIIELKPEEKGETPTPPHRKRL
jgi:hypothetical protein